MDGEPLYLLPGLSSARRRGRRVQRQIHVEPDGAARRRGGDAAGACAPDLSQFLSAGIALGVRRHPAGGGFMSRGGALTAFHDLAPAEESFRSAVLWGLSRRSKSLPCRFLYDERGSALFAAICELPEYYLTRTEMAILEDHAPEIAALAGRHVQLIEFGSGSSRKVRLLLDALEDPAAYVAIDISRQQLRDAASGVAAEFPEGPMVAARPGYLQPLLLPALPAAGDGPP